MNTLLYIVLSTFIVSLVSFVGVFALSIKEKVLEKVLFYLVSLSIGGLMGGAFLHLLPEAVEIFEGPEVFLYVLAGFFLFMLIEKIIHWRHCHTGHCEIHTFAHMSLIGDAIHNFIDGLIMAAGFVVNPGVGIASTIAIILHEVPQEMGDFGVLVYAGIKRKTALLLNFLTAVTAVLGGVVGFYLLSFSQSISGYLVAFAAGGFIYIAASDLIPEIRKENKVDKSILNFSIIFLGILLMYLLRFFE